ncbi:myosin heavy chain-related [Zea mays]|uniref:Myosin heavy chain-related n=1 Tax=Zea mays TaxID=4577 RepID=A0A1D6JXM0_MAIZE|nr:myosin heavy chain-related [Zea mays]
MEAHASRGRRTLEEIRQKRAAERMQHAVPIAASHVDSHGNQRAGAEHLARVQELENGNTELERENKMLLSKIAEKEVEKDALVNRLNDLERNVVPSLKKSLNDIYLEKDAAVVAKEDALAQLRSMKKRLKEAEEEQYRAEEDSASLRAQLNTLQQQMGHTYSGYTMGTSSEESVAMEKEIQDLQAQLKQESLLRQQEQQQLAEQSQLRQQEQEKLAKEQTRIASLEAEKQQLEDQITMLTKKATGMEDTYTYIILSFIYVRNVRTCRRYNDEDEQLNTSPVRSQPKQKTHANSGGGLGFVLSNSGFFPDSIAMLNVFDYFTIHTIVALLPHASISMVLQSHNSQMNTPFGVLLEQKASRSYLPGCSIRLVLLTYGHLPILEDASEFAARKAFSMQDREKLEQQLHDMALMIERLEGSRQKLLMEIDSQSSEIEKLFEENSALSASYQEAIDVTVQWENQVRDCLKQNEELRSHLEKLRLEQVSLLKVSNIATQSDGQTENSISNPPQMVIENISLKDQLIKEQSRSEGLSAEIMKLSAELRKAVHAQNNLARLYRPVLRDIESNLMKMKQETYATIQ